jgi:signal transduction histidine kinase
LARESGFSLSSEWLRARGNSVRLPRSDLPLLPIAPAIVVVLGIVTALAIGLLGIAQLQTTSDDAAELRANALVATLAARLRTTAVEDRGELIGRAARRSAAEILLVDLGGQVLVNESFGAPTKEEVIALLAAREGEARTALGRARYASTPLPAPYDHLTLLSFVAAPSPPQGSIALVNAVAALTALLLGIAVAVALAFMKAARDDVDYVRQRIVDMARDDADPAGEPIPIRSLDQVGVLTAAFNLLVARFAAAERSYRADIQQASVMDRERAAFLAGLSHELRTPLNAILGFSHVLESEVDGPLSEDAREYLQVINQSGEHLRTLIDDVLDLSALETGQLRLTRRAVDTRQLADQVAREASALLDGKAIQLMVSGDPGLYAYADARRVRQIITNLISNAIKFTTEGWVVVHVEARGSFIAILVRDTGAGIPPEETAAIFEEYRQSGDLRSRRRGTGLGLAIAKRLVGMHGGTIEVTSEVGKGSTFTVCLPRSTGNEETEGQRASDPSVRFRRYGFGKRPA